MPINAVLAALDPHEHDYPTPLADAGYRVAGLEVPLNTSAGDVVPDLVAANSDRSRLLLVESKSGAGLKQKQASRLAVAEWEEVIRAADIDLEEMPQEQEVVVVYVALARYAAGIRERLEDKAHDEFVVISVGDDELDIIGPCSDAALARQTWPFACPLPPPRRLPLDQESDIADYFDPVAATLVGAARAARGMAPEELQVAVDEIVRDVVPSYEYLVNLLVRRAIRAKVETTVDAVIHVAPRVFARSVRDGVSTVAVLETPEEHKLQGRTQSYQRVLRQMQDAIEDSSPQVSLFAQEEDS